MARLRRRSLATGPGMVPGVAPDGRTMAVSGPVKLYLFADGSAAVTYPSGYTRDFPNETEARADLRRRRYDTFRTITADPPCTPSGGACPACGRLVSAHTDAEAQTCARVAAIRPCYGR